MILFESETPSGFLSTNVIERKKPYATDRLKSKWLQETSVVYIGSAEPRDGLFGRLGDFANQSSSHTGGRALWQLSDPGNLLAAWMETPDEVATVVKKWFLMDFKQKFGKYPFANWRL